MESKGTPPSSPQHKSYKASESDEEREADREFKEAMNMPKVGAIKSESFFGGTGLFFFALYNVFRGLIDDARSLFYLC